MAVVCLTKKVVGNKNYRANKGQAKKVSVVRNGFIGVTELFQGVLFQG